MNTYDIGDKVRIQGAFSDLSGAAVDPTTVECSVREPDGTITTYAWPADPEVVRLAVGEFAFDLPVDAAGVWAYRFAGTGPGHAAGERQFAVRRSYFL